LIIKGIFFLNWMRPPTVVRPPPKKQRRFKTEAIMGAWFWVSTLVHNIMSFGYQGKIAFTVLAWFANLVLRGVG
jgi:hypothetical protein